MKKNKTPVKSGDIRSYFKTFSTASVQSPQSNNETKVSASPPRTKRKAIVLSDDEDDVTEQEKEANIPDKPDRGSKKIKAESQKSPDVKTKCETTPRRTKSISSKREACTGKKNTEPEEVAINPAEFFSSAAIQKKSTPAVSCQNSKKEKNGGNLLESKTLESRDETILPVKEVFEELQAAPPGRNKRTFSNESEVHVSPPSKKKQHDPLIEPITTPSRKPTSEISGSDAPLATPEEKKRQNASNYFKYLSRAGPQNLGAKEFPESAPNCLANLTFVLTGVMPSFERDDVVDVINKYGGRVTGGVSRKTSYVIIGNDAGASKTKKAEALGIPLISEDEFLDMLRKFSSTSVSSSSGAEDTNRESLIVEDVTDTEMAELSIPKSGDDLSPVKIQEDSLELGQRTETQRVIKSLPESKKSPPKETRNALSSSEKNASLLDEKPGSILKFHTAKDARHEPSKSQPLETNGLQNDPQSASSLSKNSSVTEPTFKVQSVSAGPPVLMWVDKYKPTALKNVVGQTGDRSNAKKLLLWLQNWFQYHRSANDKAKAGYPGLRDPDGKSFKAALLSGPPGIGKTTTAHLCCAELNYDYYEMNASDQRNKKGLHEGISDSLSSTTIMFPSAGSSISKSNILRKHVLIMDEVDGMSGNEDRGGVQELIALIKTSRIPIICICNDRSHPKIKTLANYCFDLRFTKPRNEQLKGFVQSICFKEKIKIPPETIQQLIIGTDQDVRQILHQLQMFQDSDAKPVYNPRKDLRLGPWDVIRKIFSSQEHQGMSINDKASLFFQDYNIGPLFVQENYLRSIPTAATGNKLKLLSLVKSAAEALVIGDCVDSIVRKNNAWSLLPVQAIFSSVIPGEYMEGTNMSGVDFPQWLGKNSNRNKRARLIQEVHNHVHLQISGSADALNLDYLPYLRRSVVTPLSKGDIEEAAHRMTSYFLLRDDLESLNDLALWPDMRNDLDKLDSKSKAAFTRLVNKESFVPYSVVKVSKGRGKGSTETDDNFEDLLGEAGEEKNAEDEEENDDLEADAMIKVKKPRAKADKCVTKKKK